MFEKLIENLEKINGKTFELPVNTDDEGYYDRECPDEDCLYQFKVKADQLNEIPEDQDVFCPLCGLKSTKNMFATTEQVECAKDQFGDYLGDLIHNSLVDGARDFNSRQSRNGFFSLKMTVEGGRRSSALLPIPAKEIFERKIQCENCDKNYAVIGSAFFCPHCGHNSAENTFDNTMEKIEASIKYIPKIRESLSVISADEAELTCSTIIEKGLGDCVTALQRFCEVVYKKQINAISKIAVNSFQRIDLGSKLWKEILGQSYEDWLNPEEYKRMKILFQRRHLLQHTEGIVDDVYIKRTNDGKYTVGQRVVVKESDVLELFGYVKRIVSKIKEKSNGT